VVFVYKTDVQPPGFSPPDCRPKKVIAKSGATKQSTRKNFRPPQLLQVWEKWIATGERSGDDVSVLSAVGLKLL